MSFLFNEPWLLFLAVFLLLCGSSAIGYRLAFATHINDVSHHHDEIRGLRDGLFVLLGLLLGFTIAMVLPRFDQREELVVKEANAIRTTMLGAEMLPEPQRGKTLEVLREYVGVRHSFANVTLVNRTSFNRNLERTRELQDELWQQIVGVTRENQSAVISAYARSLSDMINMAELRTAVFEHRVPKEVWIVILLVAVFQTFVAGYNLKQRFWLSLVITPLVIAVVMTLIADLDSPRKGFIQIEQNSMERLATRVATGEQ